MESLSITKSALCSPLIAVTHLVCRTWVTAGALSSPSCTCQASWTCASVRRPSSSAPCTAATAPWCSSSSPTAPCTTQWGMMGRMWLTTSPSPYWRRRVWSSQCVYRCVFIYWCCCIHLFLLISQTLGIQSLMLITQKQKSSTFLKLMCVYVKHNRGTKKRNVTLCIIAISS